MQMMRLVTRILLLFFSICIVSLVFIGRCGFRLEELTASQASVLGFTEIDEQQSTSYLEALRRKEEEHKRETQRLHEEIQELKKQLSIARSLQDGVKPIALETKNLNAEQDSNRECTEYIKKQVNAAEILHGVQLNNEYEVIPFSHFTFSRLYPVTLGLGKRVVEKPIGYKKKDLLEVFVRALEVVNKGRQGKQRYTVDDFVEGMYRNEPTTGTQYHLYFKEKNTTKAYHRVVLMRPFSSVQSISNEMVRTSKELINIVLPLSGRIDTFRNFMDKFVKVGIKYDRKVFLTVVYFGEEGLQDVRVILTKMSRETRFKNIKLLTLNETFSRGKGLQLGAQHWTKGDVLLFMCDVDIVFSAKFLERCRMNASPGRKVYYPIVFSLYNPSIVYNLHGKSIPSETDQLMISKDTGFWRDFGFGMTCQYRSDFMNIKGFDEQIIGWGGEDVMLYRKYVKSPLTVIRSTDPGIFHMWHEKTCDPKLSFEQYRSCLRSKALNEASHAQLGLLAFEAELRKHSGPSDTIPNAANFMESFNMVDGV